MISAGAVWLGTHILTLGTRGFAVSNLVLVIGWLGLAYLLLKKYRSMEALQSGQTA